MKSSMILLASIYVGVTSAFSESRSFDSFAPYIEDFNGFRGTEESLPSGFSITSAGGTSIFRGEFNSSSASADDFTGIMGATSDGTNYALAWRESTGAAALGDARVLLAITNNTGSPIYGFEISYDLQAWVNGRRDNEMRLKYDIYPDSASSPIGIAFESDVWTRNTVRTRNPNHTPIASNGAQFVLNGDTAGNFTRVTGIIDLASLLVNEADSSAGVFGPLEDGQTAYFRWQISNNQLTGGNRSALGLDHLVITPLATPPQTAPVLEWKPGVGGDGVWQASGGSDWSGGEWQENAVAVFGGAPGSVTLDGDIAAADVIFNSGYQLESGPGASLQIEGLLNVADAIVATLSAPIGPDGFLRKQGDGTLLLASPQTHAGQTSIFAGVLQTTTDHAHSPHAAMTITPGAVFDLDGTTQTIAGLNGQRDGLVQLGDGGTLIFDVKSGSFAYRADLEGDGNVIKRGAGRQRFRSEKKTYSGYTRIEEGVLEITGNGEMSETSFIEVMPAGELFLVGDSSSGPPETFGGPVLLKGGRLAAQNINDEALYFVDYPVEVQIDGSTINVSGSDSVMIMDQRFGGQLQGGGRLRKSGAGVLELTGNHTHSGGFEVSNGRVSIQPGASVSAGPLSFPDPQNTRRLDVKNLSHTVTRLDGDAPSPNDPEAVNTLILEITSAGSVFTVNQGFEVDEDGNEVTSRFQGEISGAGNFVKSGDGLLAFTRWPKTYTGTTTIHQGVLAVSHSATPETTAGVTVNSGGQLRLTSGGDDLEYSFGGTLAIAGSGRGGNTVEGDGMGVLGALRYEASPGSFARLTNPIAFVSGGGVGLHVSTHGNTLALGGSLLGSGSEWIAKTGGGKLVLESTNGGLTRPWLIANGGLEIAVDASSGAGSVTVDEGGTVSGSGMIGGNLSLRAGASLIFDVGTQAAISVAGVFDAAEAASVTVMGTLAEGTYKVMTADGGIVGASSLVVAGLEGTGYLGQLATVGNDLMLNLEASGEQITTFAMWSGGVGPDDDVNGNGAVALLEFALGADSPGGEYSKPAPGMLQMDGVDYLTLRGMFRSDAPTLVVTGEVSTDLGNAGTWDPNAVEMLRTENPDVPQGVEERIYRTPANGARRFLRLKVVDTSLDP